MKPRTSLMSALLVAAVAVPIGMLALAAWLNYRQVEREAYESAIDTATVLTGHALRTIRGHELVIDFVVGHIAGMSWDRVRTSRRLWWLLHSIAEEYEDIATIVLIGPDGRTALSTAEWPAPQVDASDRDYFIRLREGAEFFISAPAIGRVTGARFFTLARRLPGEEGAFAGLVAVSVNPSYFESFYRTFLRENEAASLIRDDGTVLVRYPPVEDLVHVLPPTSALRQAVEDGGDKGVLRHTSSVDGMERIVGHDRVDHYPVHATFQLAMTTVWAQWRAAMLPYLLASLLALAALLIAARLAYQRARRQLAEQHRIDAEEANRAKDRYVATVSHEIRNPLSAIATAAALLRRSPENATMASEIIARQCTHLRAILDDLQDTARTMFGKLSIVKQPLELRQVAEQAVSDRAGRDSAVRFEVAGSPAWIEGDLVRVRQMVDNLLENAVRYGASRVSITVERAGDCSILSVTDNGQGIDPELLPRLFQPFVQGEPPAGRARAGLGLGLALVSHLAALQGGHVAARSRGPGRGSTFTLSFPARGLLPLEKGGFHGTERQRSAGR